MKKIKNDLAPKMEEIVPVSIFHSEVAAWVKRIGVTPKEIRLRPMKRKWASCSSRGRLTFDTALLYEPAAFRREVIVHELLHLKVPNHGKVFKALLRTYLV
ncbi:MAG: M48 family metallopeptidase [Anaerolineae bacterium]|nr:M48 family metallopeptidase [Anaerolineae bacterium]